MFDLEGFRIEGIAFKCLDILENEFLKNELNGNLNNLLGNQSST